MLKKIIKVSSVLLIAGFSFLYTEKVTKIIRKKDPIMIKLNEIKKDSYIDVIKPIINNDEYYTGINGCTLDIENSYNKMKTVKEFKKELIVMKEVKNKQNLNNKYIIGANKLEKKVSIVFISDKDIDDKIVNYLLNKKVKANFFVDLNYLENNSVSLKFISENNNIYYLGNNNIYDDKYMIYANDLIKLNTKNESKYCFTEEKNNDTLNICSKYNMKTIKSDIIKNNLLSNVKEKLSNGSIITINSNNIDEIKTIVNYILYKGYDVVTLDNLLMQNNNCM